MRNRLTLSPQLVVEHKEGNWWWRYSLECEGSQPHTRFPSPGVSCQEEVTPLHLTLKINMDSLCPSRLRHKAAGNTDVLFKDPCTDLSPWALVEATQEEPEMSTEKPELCGFRVRAKGTAAITPVWSLPSFLC